MAEQHFTRPNVQPVITNIGTTPEQRQMSTSEFKAKFDEMPEAIQQYIKETLLIELDAFKQEFMTHQADYANTPEIIEAHDGVAYKFPSGLLICTMWKTINYDTDFQVVEFIYPVSFKAYAIRRQMNKSVAVSISCTGAYEGETYVDNVHVEKFNFVPDTNGEKGTLRIAFDRAAATRETDISLTLIGKWK